MSVKVSLNGEVSKDKSFPKLMLSDNGLIVLFTEEVIGVVVSPDEDYKLGEYSEVWAMTCFKDYEGEVTLKNE